MISFHVIINVQLHCVTFGWPSERTDRTYTHISFLLFSRMFSRDYQPGKVQIYSMSCVLSLQTVQNSDKSKNLFPVQTESQSKY